MFEPLDAKQIVSAIQPEYRKKLHNLEIFNSIDSTNSYLLTKAKNPVVIACLAEEQTGGRGRLGRVWESPLGGNIYCSLLWHFHELQSDLSSLGLVVAVTVVQALEKYGMHSGLQLKWPNDVLYAGKKLAGILLESSDRPNVVIGIGINVFSAPDEAISLVRIIPNPMRNVVIGLLLNELLENLSLFEVEGLSAFIRSWEKYDVLFDKTISVKLHEKIFTGIMRGVDEKGRLRLENEAGDIQLLSYGEVSILF